MKRTIIQDGSVTEIVVYVNWGDEDILSEAEYEAKLEEETKISAADDYEFGRWLHEYYTIAEVWAMSKEEKEKAHNQWLKYCRKCMEDELGYERRVLI